MANKNNEMQQEIIDEIINEGEYDGDNFPNVERFHEEDFNQSYEFYDEEQEDVDQNLEEESLDSEDEEELSGCGKDDPEDKAKYKEYRQIVKQIKNKNKEINAIKISIANIISKSSRTNSESSECQALKNHMNNEINALRDLVTKAIELQNFGSSRYYKYIELATSFEEDQLS